MSEEPAAVFTMPVCPSVNNLFLNGKAGRVRGAQYRRWQHDAGWHVKLQKPASVAGPVRIEIAAPLHRRRDVDNALKPSLDLIVSLGIIENDNWVDDLRIIRTSGHLDMIVKIWRIE